MNSQTESRKRYTEKRLRRAFEYLGEKCVVCGSTESLQFDHINPASKDIDITTAIFMECWAWHRLVTELNKCQLLCKPHHVEKSSMEGSFGTVAHGGGLSGKKNCPCSLCKQKKAEYMKAYKARR